MANPFSIPPQPADGEALRAYRLNREVSLNNQEIQAALRAAVLAKAAELAPLGKLSIPTLSMDAQMASNTNKIESVGVLATVEVMLAPSSIARLLREEPEEPKETIVLTDDLMIEKPAESGRQPTKNLVSKALEKLAQG